MPKPGDSFPIMQYFAFGHLPEELRSTSKAFSDFANWLLAQPHGNNAEVAAGLRKLLEAKDCFVRAQVK